MTGPSTGGGSEHYAKAAEEDRARRSRVAPHVGAGGRRARLREDRTRVCFGKGLTYRKN